MGLNWKGGGRGLGEGMVQTAGIVEAKKERDFLASQKTLEYMRSTALEELRNKNTMANAETTRGWNREDSALAREQSLADSARTREEALLDSDVERARDKEDFYMKEAADYDKVSALANMSTNAEQAERDRKIRAIEESDLSTTDKKQAILQIETGYGPSGGTSALDKAKTIKLLADAKKTNSEAGKGVKVTDQNRKDAMAIAVESETWDESSMMEKADQVALLATQMAQGGSVSTESTQEVKPPEGLSASDYEGLKGVVTSAAQGNKQAVADLKTAMKRVSGLQKANIQKQLVEELGPDFDIYEIMYPKDKSNSSTYNKESILDNIYKG